MNRIRSIAIATALLALGAFAVPAVTMQAVAAQDGQVATVPPVEPQLKLLTEKLELSAEQQDKIKPILQDLYDTTGKLVQDENIARDERHAARLTADKKIRVILSDEQKKKLDQVESEPHPELHGDLH